MLTEKSQTNHGARNVETRKITTIVANFPGGSYHDFSTDRKDSRSSGTTRNTSFIFTNYSKQVCTEDHGNRYPTEQDRPGSCLIYRGWVLPLLLEMSQTSKFTIGQNLCGNVYVGLYYKMVGLPVGNRVNSTVYFH